MASFSRKNQRFACAGVCLTRPADLMEAGKFPYLKNVRVKTQGVLQAREGITATDDTPLDQLEVHSVRRLNDPSPDATPAWTRVIGSGTKLYTGQGPYSEVDDGYSGDPLSMIPFRPEKSPQAWMYVADSNKMRKVRADGTDYGVGVAPPLAAPSAEISDGIAYDIIDAFAAVGSLAQGGTAGALSAAARLSTTIADIVYDSGSTGWCLIQPTAMDETLQPGMLIDINSAETVVVQSVASAVSSTTIAAITYDSGSAGLCTIQLSAPTKELARDSMLLLGGSEAVRVLSVTTGPDGLSSFRCSTTGTFAVTNAVAGLASFRCKAGAHSAAETLVANYVQTSITSGIGYLGLAAAKDLSKIGSRPTQGEDLIHVSILVDNPSNIVEGKLLLDCDGATNDFTQNYFYYAFHANEIQSNVSNTLTTLTAAQAAALNQALALNASKSQLGTSSSAVLHYYQPGQLIEESKLQSLGQQVLDHGTAGTISQSQALAIYNQIGAGQSQWTELVIPVSQLQRVGTDTSRGLANIAAYRVQLKVNATTILRVASWWLGGGYGPNVSNQQQPLQYRCRYRSSVTGAKSIPSPSTRYGLLPQRQRVVLTATASSDAQVDKIDFERFGGPLNEWHYIGTADNTSPTFNDDFDSLSIVGNAPLEIDAYQPFPVVDLPKSGTCNVAGTAVTNATGDDFNTAWARGTQIKIDGVPYELYAQPGSVSILETIQNVGVKTGVKWEIAEPVLLGQPLPVMWGPYGDGDVNLFMFAVGDTRNPGTLYYTKGGDPDSAPDTHQVEITSPSEPLIGGAMFDGRSVVFSSDRAFEVRPDPSRPNGVAWQQLAFGRGLWSKWAICSGLRLPKLWVLSHDGIYEYDAGGGEPKNITKDDLYPIFPHDGAAAANIVGGVPAPNMASPEDLRLAYGDGYLYFDYLRQDGSGRATLVYDTKINGWFPCAYVEPQGMHYFEEGERVHALLSGGFDGLLYVGGALRDGVNDIPCRVTTPAFDGGDRRAVNFFGDVMVDAYTESADVEASVLIDGYSGAGTLMVNTPDRMNVVVDLNDGAGQSGQNIAVDFTWSSGELSIPLLYSWEPSWIGKVEDTLRRVTDHDDAGTPGAKYVRGMLIEANTDGVNKTVSILGDDDAVIELEPAVPPADPITTLTLNHPVQSIKMYSLANPFVAHYLRLLGTDDTVWQQFRVAWIFDQWPETSTAASPWIAPLNTAKPKYMRGFTVPMETGGDPAGLLARFDGRASVPTYTLPDATTTAAKKTPVQFAFNPPVLCHEVQIQPADSCRLWLEEIVWDAEEWPEKIAEYYPFDSLGTSQVKNLRRISLPIETGGDLVDLRLRSDAGNAAPFLNLRSADLVKTGVTLVPTAPLIAHHYQLESMDPCRVWYGEAKWEFEVWPELTIEPSPWMSLGNPGAKFMRSLVIPIDTHAQSVLLHITTSDGDGAIAGPFLTPIGQKTPVAYAFTTPLIGHEFRIQPLSPCRMWLEEARWDFEPWPELIAAASNWMNAGAPHNKFFQGFIIPLDTNGQAITFTIRYPGGTVQAGPFTTTTKQKTPMPFSFPTPFNAREVQFVPSGACRAWYDEIQWVVEPAPESGTTWKTQPTTHDLQGWQHVRRGYIAYSSTAQVTMRVYKDGTAYTQTLPSTNGAYSKYPVEFEVMKGKSYEYEFTSSQAFSIWKRDCEMQVRSWGDPGPYRSVNPFGDISRVSGAEI
jgi:hypothetical protein